MRHGVEYLKKTMPLIILALMALTIVGCVSVGKRDPNSTLPANRPGSWEGTTLGLPL